MVHRQEIGHLTAVDDLVPRAFKHAPDDGRMAVGMLVIKDIARIATTVTEFLVQARLILPIRIEEEPAVLDPLDFVHIPHVPLGEDDVGILGILLRQVLLIRRSIFAIISA